MNRGEGARATPPTVLIGVGNRDRGDDAAGPIVCDLVVSLGPGHIRTSVLESSVVDLPTYWEADDRVVIVDAAQPRGRPGRIDEYDGLAGRFAVPASVSTHSIDVAGAIELARVTGSLPAALSVVAIEGVSFDFGEPLTPAVRRSVDEIVGRLGLVRPSPIRRSRLG